MYEISLTGQFKKDFKLITKRSFDITKLEVVLELLQALDQLPPEYKEHPLRGTYKNHFDCHIDPDWILIFIRNKKEKLITLIRTGTHSDLFK